MGTTVMPSTRIKTHIEALIRTGAITGELLKNWKRRAEEHEQMVDTLRQADRDGNVAAMYHVYRGYRHGKRGFPENHAVAYEWLQRARRAGCIKSTATLGGCMMLGKLGNHVFDKNAVQGSFLLGTMAEQGSDMAALQVGFFYLKGIHGFPLDREQAKVWLRRGLCDQACPHKHAASAIVQKARQKLDALLSLTSSNDNPDRSSSNNSNDDDTELSM